MPEEWNMTNAAAHTAVVVLNHNTGAELDLCIESLRRAATAAPYEVYVVDNASEPAERRRCSELCAAAAEKGGRGFTHLQLEENLGFAGGNNHAICLLLGRAGVTHIALLNSDVIVADGWLDALLFCGSALAGPVSNVGGGFQTVHGEAGLVMDETALAETAALAAARRETYGDFCREAEMLTFFAVLVRREVFEDIGLLDERFFHGQFEDDDFCLRAAQAGHGMAVARGCYLHHWGGCAFEADEVPPASFQENLARFEEKWGRPHTPREAEIYRSAMVDVEYLAQKGVVSAALAAEVNGALRRAQKDRARLLRHYHAMKQRAEALPTIDGLPEIPARQIPRQLWHKLRRRLSI